MIRLLALVALAATTHAADSAAVRIALKTAKGEPVADAVVSLLPAGGVVPAPAGEAELMQQDEQFSPYVTAVQVGGRVVLPNKDTVQHHVYSLSKAKKFELPLYAPGMSEVITFDQPGLVAIGCNIHDWMVAYIVVVPTPYFAKTDTQGQATVAAPAGRYRVEVWHPRLSAALVQEIVLPATGTLTRDFALTLKPERRIRRGGVTRSGGY